MPSPKGDAPSAAERVVLPLWIRPKHYVVSIRGLEFGGNWTYQGTVTLHCSIKNPEAWDTITLNAHEIKVHGAQLKLEHAPVMRLLESRDVRYDDAQRVYIKFAPDDVNKYAGDAMLTIQFEGTINDKMEGFYRSRYKATGDTTQSTATDGGSRCMFSTQFEACSARRAFPCFDEPNVKATFDVELEVPKDQTALSNMPVKEIKPSAREGFHTVLFERTPIMSTYLLAWAIGDFEYVEGFTKRQYNGKHLPVRVYTTRGLQEQGRFALENAHQVVDLFSEAFQIDYPLPKLDLLACHEFSYGAMENWGLITYRTTALLFDEATSAESYRNRVAYVVAHELAHQWFGNLVTMEWWSELWLNEGFATWVGWWAIDQLYPDWDVWAQFVTDSVQSAFQFDSMRTSHPIEVPVAEARDIEQIFDAISYRKGSSVIRMLDAYLGDKVFFRGVADYLKAHQYGNATTRDLWAALSNASGRDLSVFMEPWTKAIGFPVVVVAEEPGQISVRQQRFLLSGDVQPEDDQTEWWIPLGLQTGPSAGKAHKHGVGELTQKEDTLRDVDEAFYLVNKDLTGFFRTNYPPARLVRLAEAKDHLSHQDKIGLVGDAYANAIAGYGKATSLLALAERFKDETNYLVWQQVIGDLNSVRTHFSDIEDIEKALRKFTLELVTPAVETMGWEFQESEGLLTRQLRGLLITTAGLAGHQGIVAEAMRRFELYTSGKDAAAVHPSLRGAVLGIAVKEGGEAAYKAVKDMYVNNTSIDGKEICLQALGRTQTAELVHDFVRFVFSSAVPMQDKHSGAAALSRNAKGRPALWRFLRDEWEGVVQTALLGNRVVTDQFLSFGLVRFSRVETADEIQAFFATKNTNGFDKALRTVGSTIRAHAAFRARDHGVVREWLAARGYLA